MGVNLVLHERLLFKVKQEDQLRERLQEVQSVQALVPETVLKGSVLRIVFPAGVDVPGKDVTKLMGYVCVLVYWLGF